MHWHEDCGRRVFTPFTCGVNSSHCLFVCGRCSILSGLDSLNLSDYSFVFENNKWFVCFLLVFGRRTQVDQRLPLDCFPTAPQPNGLWLLGEAPEGQTAEVGRVKASLTKELCKTQLLIKDDRDQRNQMGKHSWHLLGRS